jgi:hypothetical protein
MIFFSTVARPDLFGNFYITSIVLVCIFALFVCC